MKINANTTPLGVEGLNPAKRPAPTAAPAGEADSFAGSTAVNNALEGLPESRPGAVERARQLINDPQYPGPDVLQKVSNLLAGQIGGAGE